MEIAHLLGQLGGHVIVRVIDRITTGLVRHVRTHVSRGEVLRLAPGVAAPRQAELRLIDPQKGEVLWTVGGLHATHFTLAPSENHVLVDVGSSITTPINR